MNAQQRAVTLLSTLGWSEIRPSAGEVLLRSVLAERLRAINSFEHKGERREFSAEAIDSAIESLSREASKDVALANERLWLLLRLGTEVEERIGHLTRRFRIRYVDWDQPQNNSFHVTQGFEAERSGYSPDFVLFVNGIPFVVAEVKSGAGGEGQLNEAIRKLSSYELASANSGLFAYSQLLLMLTPAEAEYGCVGAERHYWSTWRERSGAPASIRSVVTGVAEEPGGDSIPVLADAQDKLIFALCRPGRLLDLVRWFTFFSSGSRKIARHHQYFSALDILQRVKERNVDGTRTGGFLRLAQGTGKTFTLVMVSRVLLDVFQDPPARVVLVTDRAEMDNQLSSDLLASGIDSRRANTGQELRELLRETRFRVIVSLLQKFDAAVNRNSLATDSPDLFVLVDEADRSQSGQQHHSMRVMLPRACFIGFTGTVLLTREQGNLEAAFGDLIGTPYTTQDALRDHILLPMLFESRRLSGSLDEVREFNPFSEARTLPQLNEAEIRSIANDVSTHFTRHFAGTEFKGLLVAPSRGAAVGLKLALDQLGQVFSEVLISTEARDTELEFNLFGADEQLSPAEEFRKAILNRFHSEARYDADVISRFKDSDRPQILIVVNRLLTGIDIPRIAVIYLARSLGAPMFLQAVSRANRPYPGKERGLVVDYVGTRPNFDDEPDFFSGIRARQKRNPRPLVHDEVQFVLNSPKTDSWDELKTKCGYLLREEFEKAGYPLPNLAITPLAGRIAAVIQAKRKVDWTRDRDVQNQMRTGIEDILFEFRSESRIALDLSAIDAILERCVEAARELVP